MTKVFDCTLRDSSYVVDFMLDVATTAAITRGLNELGVSYIEVGHGLGLGGARLHGKSAGASDSAYLEAALKSTGASKVGCFLIAGNATKDEITRCADDGAHFIRIGVPDNATDAAIEAMETLAGRKIEVFPFLMASSVWPLKDIERFLDRLKPFTSAGCYFVDSAGCLFGHRTAAALSHFKQHFNGARCFHGHNNLQTAVSNCLKAAELDFAFVDGTLGGFGRSGGNAPSEILLSLLNLKDAEPISRAIALAEEFAKRVGQDYDYWDVALGLTGTHSRFLGKMLASGRSRDAIFKDLYRDRQSASAG